MFHTFAAIAALGLLEQDGVKRLHPFLGISQQTYDHYLFMKDESSTKEEEV